MGNPMIRLASAAVSLALVACASSGPSVAARSVLDGDPAVVNRDCKLLGTVNGRSLLGGVADEAKVQNAMNDAREKAAAMGATHVVFVAANTSGMMNAGHASARAYRCDAKG
jgi:hypothetical protein